MTRCTPVSRPSEITLPPRLSAGAGRQQALCFSWKMVSPTHPTQRRPQEGQGDFPWSFPTAGQAGAENGHQTGHCGQQRSAQWRDHVTLKGLWCSLPGTERICGSPIRICTWLVGASGTEHAGCRESWRGSNSLDPVQSPGGSSSCPHCSQHLGKYLGFPTPSVHVCGRR